MESPGSVATNIERESEWGLEVLVLFVFFRQGKRMGKVMRKEKERLWRVVTA